MSTLLSLKQKPGYSSDLYRDTNQVPDGLIILYLVNDDAISAVQLYFGTPQRQPLLRFVIKTCSSS